MLNLAYLFDPRPGPLPPDDVHLQLALMGLFAAALGASIFWSCFRRASLPLWRIVLCEIPLSLLVVGLMAARLLAIPYLSMRVLFYGAMFLSLGGWAAYLLAVGHRTGFLKRQLALLTFSWREEQPSTSRAAGALLLAVHFLGLMILGIQFGRSYWCMVALFLVLLSPQLLVAAWTRKWILHLEALTPLCLAYLAAVSRRLCAKLLTQPLPLYDGFTYPEPFSSLLNIEAIFFAAVMYVLLCQGYLLVLRWNRLDRYRFYVGAALMSAALIWAGAEYFRHRTHGVTANDPYAYSQMAVDIARQGHPMHRFALFPRISNLGISWWPVVHYGYQVRVPPLRGDGSTAADWPAGWPVTLSLWYLLLGEEGLYVANPVVSLLCLAGVLAVVAEVLYDRPWDERLLGGAFASFALATSYEHIDRLLVPMADASVQLFTLLTLFLVLRGMRGRQRVYALLAGLSFGWAFFIRHTQLVLGLCAVVAVLALGRHKLSHKERWEFLGLFGLAALVVAIPDLLYHHFVFGNFLTPESTELELFSLTNVRVTARLMWQRFLSGNEFGYLSPLVVYGAYRTYVERRGQFLVLLTAVLGILLVHLPYAALRLRDLLSLFPVLLALCGCGVADLWTRVQLRTETASYARYALSVAILLALLLVPVLRTWPILPRPRGSYRASFGYVSTEERRAFNLLAEYAVEPCVVGSSLNGGPIDLYAGREAFRPAFWTEEELDVFFGQMFSEGTAVYILDDGDALGPSLDHAEAHYEVIGLVRLGVPIFGDPDRVSGVLYEIRPHSEVSR
ncbi:MAG: glycosyltransferase family 39 protein [Anaerolineae bacterium]